MQHHLLADIEAFLTRAAMSPTRLGQEALGDKHFVKQLRNGRRVWPETEQKVRAYIRQAESAEGSAA